MSEITLDRARAIRRFVGAIVEQHALDCGICASSDVFICEEMRRVLAVKFRWMRRIQALEQEEKPV